MLETPEPSTSPDTALRGASLLRLLPFLLLALHLGLGLHALPHLAVTVDEFLHVPVGLATLESGAPTLDRQNAPFFRTLLFGGALRVLGVQSPALPGEAAQNAWAASYLFMVEHYDRYVALMNVPRMVVLFCSILLALLVYGEARHRFGVRGGRVALVLYAFCPLVLAHSRLATLDLGLSLFWFASSCAFFRHSRQPSLSRAALVGVMLGLALGVKFTSVLLAALLTGLELLACLRERSRTRAGGLLMGGLTGILTLNAAYLFDRVGLPLAEVIAALRIQAGDTTFCSLAVPHLPGMLPVPLPLGFLEGLLAQWQDSAGYLYFLRGELSSTGWKSYFVLGLLLKLTLPALVLVGLGVARSSRAPGRPDLLELALPPTLLLGVLSLAGHKNIGVRYVLPALPYLYVLAAGVVVPRPPRGAVLPPDAGGIRLPDLSPVPSRGAAVLSPAGLALVALLGSHAASGILCGSSALAYFNPLAGGSSGGLHWLGDSNLDWGQDLPRLAEWLRDHHVGEVQLAYFGRVDPELYGIRYRVLRGRGEPGWIAVSASFLQGIPYIVLEQNAVQKTDAGFRWQGRLERVPPGYYRWLLQHAPEAIVGGSIYVYRLEPRARREPDTGSVRSAPDP